MTVSERQHRRLKASSVSSNVNNTLSGERRFQVMVYQSDDPLAILSESRRVARSDLPFLQPCSDSAGR